MALQMMSLQFPATSTVPPPAKPTYLHRSLHLRPNLRPFSSARKTRFSASKAVEESQEDSKSEVATTRDEPETEATDKLGAEIKELKKTMSEKGEVDFWGGVAEEIKEIEWPPFGKVLGTTGLVLGVIAGSSVVLLTVNAVLAELSDKVFAGRGVQDFFG